MNALTPIPAPIDTARATDAATPAPRQDGWTPARQRLFLEAIAAGHSVVDACAVVGLSHQSAYGFRQRATGAAFALGWQAAALLARQHLADTLYVRVIEGQVETLTRPDGSTWTRHRFDNRLAATMLARLDRLADDAAREGTHADARAVAGRFETFLESLADQCQPGPDGTVRRPQLPQLRPATAPPPEQAPEPEPAAEPVWWDESSEDFRTSFPPPDGFSGFQDGQFGEEDYSRALSDEEQDTIEAPEQIERAVRRIVEGRARDAWFADYAASHATATDAELDDCDDDDDDDAEGADDDDDIDLEVATGDDPDACDADDPVADRCDPPVATRIDAELEEATGDDPDADDPSAERCDSAVTAPIDADAGAAAETGW